MSPKVDVLAYYLSGLWMGVLLFHTLVVVPVSVKVLSGKNLGELSFLIQERFQTWGIFVLLLTFVLFLSAGVKVQAVLSGVALASSLFGEYLRRRIRGILRAAKESPRSEELRSDLMETYRFVAYSVYTQALSLGAIPILGVLGIR